MTPLQAWLFVGIPALVLGLGMFIGRSRWRPLIGYVVLAAGFGGMVAFHRVSAVVFGMLIVLLYAAGRGGAGEDRVAAMHATGVEAAEAFERDRAARGEIGEPGNRGGRGQPAGEEEPAGMSH